MKIKRALTLIVAALMLFTLFPIAASAESLSSGRVGDSYSATLKQVNFNSGSRPTYSTSGSIPPGLSISAMVFVSQATYSLRGTPTEAGSYSFTLNINAGSDHYSYSYSVRIDPKCAQHEYDDVTVMSEPTCTEDGMASGTCKNCGKYSIFTLPALGHDMTAWYMGYPEGGVEVHYGEIWECRNCKRSGCNYSECRKLYPLDGEDYSDLLQVMPPAVVSQEYDEVAITTEGTLRHVEFTGYMPDGLTLEPTSSDDNKSYSLRGTPTTEGDYFFVIEAERDGIDLKFPTYITVYPKGSVINETIIIPDAIEGIEYEFADYFAEVEGVSFSELGLSDEPDGGFFPEGMNLWDWWDNVDDFDGSTRMGWLLEGLPAKQGSYFFYYSFTGDNYRTYVYPMQITVTPHICVYSGWKALGSLSGCSYDASFSGTCEGCGDSKTVTMAASHCYGSWEKTEDGYTRACTLCGQTETLESPTYDCCGNCGSVCEHFISQAVVSNDGNYVTTVCKLCGERKRYAFNDVALAGAEITVGFACGSYYGDAYADLFGAEKTEGLEEEDRRALPEAETSDVSYYAVIAIHDMDNVKSIEFVSGRMPDGMNLVIAKSNPGQSDRLVLTGVPTKTGSYIFNVRVKRTDDTTETVPVRISVVEAGAAKLVSPFIAMQPENKTALPGDYITLKVRAKKIIGIDCSYMWYRSSSPNYDGGSPLTGIDSAYTDSLSVCLIEAGTWYYYCVVTYSVEGGGTSTTNSVIVSVTVEDSDA